MKSFCLKSFFGILAILLAVFCSPQFSAADELKVSFIYNDSGLRDPFIPASFTTSEPEPDKDENILSNMNFKLEGIMWDPVDPYVIINDEILRVGDELDGVTILKIEKESVTFGVKDKTIVVPLIGKGE